MDHARSLPVLKALPISPLIATTMDSSYRQKSLSDSQLDFTFGVWEIGKNLSSKVRQQEDQQGGFTYQRHGVYEAIRIDQPSRTPDIIKIKKQ